MIKKVSYLLEVEEGIRVLRQTSLGLWITSGRGVGTKTIDLDHRWAAPIREPFRTGRPNGTWLYVAISDPSGVPRIIGAFVRTVGGRTLFCPGVDVEISPVGADDETEERVLVDHLTLDPRKADGGWSAHVATIDPDNGHPRGINWSMKEQQGSMVPWYSFVIPDFETLDVLPAELTIPFQSPSSDLPNRPRRTLGDYKRPVVFQCAELPAENAQYFVQVDFFFSAGIHPAGLQSGAINFVSDESQIQDPAPGRWSGQTDFALVSNQFWIRAMASVRSGVADRPCLLALKSQSEALLL